MYLSYPDLCVSRFVCQVDVTYFPFDKQTCEMTYYAADETVSSVMLLSEDHVNRLELSQNPSWAVESVILTRYVKNDNLYITLSFNMRRRASFDVLTLVMPMIFLAFLNVCLFLVPIGSGEKGSLSITIFLSYGVFMTIVSHMIPHNSTQVPYLVVMVTILILVSMSSVFYTVLQSKMMSVVGDRPCRLSWFKYFNNRVIPIDIEAFDKQYTWENFLVKLDNFVFAVYFIFVSISTIVFLSVFHANV